MNSLIKVLSLAALLAVTNISLAKETREEKSHATKHEIKRGAEKAMNRVDEATCIEGDAKCAGEKAKHRVEEAGKAMKDKAKETKDKMD